MESEHTRYSSPGVKGKRGFEDLDFYQNALAVIVCAYDLARVLPVEEKYDLAAQIRRSAKSVAANIAEGYGRYHYLESLRYYSIARGELNETLAHFINARILGYIEVDRFENVYKLIRKTEQALNGFMTYIRRIRAGQEEFGSRVSESLDEYTSDQTEGVPSRED